MAIDIRLRTRETWRAVAALALGVWMASCGLAARAAPLSSADEQAIGSVVREQLDALAADDAQRAFSYATPEIRAMFGSPETFMGMVQRGYAAVVRPRSTLFFKPEARDDAAELRVQLVDREGAGWIATYRLERQRDRTWRIASCTLAPSRGQVT